MFVNKHDNYFCHTRKQCLIGLYFRNILVLWWSRGFAFFQSTINASTQRDIRGLLFITLIFLWCTQTAICFSQRNKKFRIVPKLPFILWLRNTKFKLFRNGHLLLDNKLKNLKLHPNCHSFFDHKIQNLKSYPNDLSFVYYKHQK